jgi:hypothetical protein
MNPGQAPNTRPGGKDFGGRKKKNPKIFDLYIPGIHESWCFVNCYRTWDAAAEYGKQCIKGMKGEIDKVKIVNIVNNNSSIVGI